MNRLPEKARAIIPRDKEVDLLNKQLHRELSATWSSGPAPSRRCLNLMVISKSLERIADHAANVAEEVVYLYEARDIRHTGKTAPPAADRPNPADGVILESPPGMTKCGQRPFSLAG